MVLLIVNCPRFSCVPGFSLSIEVQFPLQQENHDGSKNILFKSLELQLIQYQLFLLETKFVITWIQLKPLIEVLTLLV